MPGLTALTTRSGTRETARLHPLFAAALAAVFLQTCGARALEEAAGIELFENEIARMSGVGEKTVSGEKMYLLWDSYGFPADLTQRMAQEVGFDVDMERTPFL